jgi:peroxidase
MLWAFGQLVNHDMSITTPKPGDLCDIPVAPNDPFLDESVAFVPMNRSMSILDSLTGVAQQTSTISPFIDAGSVYGSTITRMNFIRADDSNITGSLRTSGPNLLPKNTEGLSNRGFDTRTDFFLAGDVRANENSALAVSHTLWMREHNYWAQELRMRHTKLSGDEIFDQARIIVQAEMQKVIYDEFLPALLGDGAIPGYKGYSPEVDPSIENIVSSCAFRIGHTMVGPGLLLDYGNGTVSGISMEASFNDPSQIERTGGIDAFLRGLANNVCQEVDPFMVSAIRNHLFKDQFDLLAINIERARDHGIPDFNSIRESLGFNKLDSFNDFLFHDELASVYSSTDQIDCWIGMNSEPRLDGLMVGETQRAVLARNFANIRDGDPHFYKNSITDRKLLNMIESTKFADIIRRNSDRPGSLDDVRDDVFFLPEKVRVRKSILFQ